MASGWVAQRVGVLEEVLGTRQYQGGVRLSRHLAKVCRFVLLRDGGVEAQEKTFFCGHMESSALAIHVFPEEALDWYSFVLLA